jgi:hypothetical protein
VRLLDGAEIAPGVFSALTTDDRLDWLGAFVMADALAMPYTVELKDAAGNPVLHQFKTADDLRAGALACLAAYQAIQTEATLAVQAARAGVTADDVKEAAEDYAAPKP